MKAKALACVAQREHSRVELRTKLFAYLDRQRRAAEAAGAETPAAADEAGGDREAGVEALLDWLVERDLLSTERFVEGRVRARAARFGSRRVQQELARHGVALDAQAERQLRQSEPARAHALWARRFGTVAAEPAQRAKQMRFLLARGFDAELARRVVAGTATVDGEDHETL
ncbi:MAG TPA: regulatory protein RecX [Methylibium sp.]|uniref:regulatory protein RecX n=1 Tax=Methylibium sp. TaxID=2067992 RepID=UPI002DBDE4CA|nr:regulatory protein RecX [Methylibium sp.]HEU4458872.1 regulatory protein RecX [Methylibium sp.]